MFEPLKKLVVKVLKVPPEPEAPSGAEGSLKVFRAAPNFYRYNLYLWMFRQAFLVLVLGSASVGLLLAALGKFGEDPIKAAIAGGAGVLAGLLLLGLMSMSYATLRLDYEMRWYKVTDRSLRIREGVVFVREMTMTFANIQNISISQGPVQRFFKIADLKVETAGGGGGHAGAQQNQEHAFNMHVGFFRGVDNAEAIRDLMMDRLKRLRDAGLGDADDSHGERSPGQEVVEAPEVDVLRAILDEARQMRAQAEARR